MGEHMSSASNVNLYEPPQPFDLASLLAVWTPPSRKLNFCGQCGRPLNVAHIDGRERQICSAVCGYIVWDHPVPVVAAIVELNAEIVVLVRNKGWPEGLFGLVSGFAESGETAEQAILREVKEELGVNGQIAQFVGVYPFFELNQLILVYHLTAQGEVQIGDELAEIRLIRPGRLRPWSFAAGLALQDWLEQRNIV
jgi:NAD+ diphosphatase